jgi:hypothetical protein
MSIVLLFFIVFGVLFLSGLIYSFARGWKIGNPSENDWFFEERS